MVPRRPRIRRRVTGLILDRGSCTLRGLKTFVRDCRGGPLMETVIALTIFVSVGSAVLVGTSTVHKSGSMTQSQSIVENIARNQLAYVFEQAYKDPGGAYLSINDAPAGYAVTAAASTV